MLAGEQSILQGCTRMAVSAAPSAASIAASCHSLVSFDFCCVSAIFIIPACVACPHIQRPCVSHLQFRKLCSKNIVLCVYVFISKCSALLGCSAYIAGGSNAAVSIALHKSLRSIPQNPAQHLGAKVINEFFLFLLMEFWVPTFLFSLFLRLALNEATSHLCQGFYNFCAKHFEKILSQLDMETHPILSC